MSDLSADITDGHEEIAADPLGSSISLGTTKLVAERDGVNSGIGVYSPHKIRQTKGFSSLVVDRNQTETC